MFALEWVQKYIRLFGGDKDEVTSGKKPCTWRWIPLTGGAACILDVQGDW